MKVTVKKSTPLDRLVENRIKHVERPPLHPGERHPIGRVGR